MSRTKRHTPAAMPTEVEPQPWRTHQDATGWHLAARGSGRPGPAPLISVELDLDAEQSAWLDAEAQRTGLDYITLLKQLVDHSRQGAAVARGVKVSTPT